MGSQAREKLVKVLDEQRVVGGPGDPFRIKADEKDKYKQEREDERERKVSVRRCDLMYCKCDTHWAHSYALRWTPSNPLIITGMTTLLQVRAASSSARQKLLPQNLWFITTITARHFWMAVKMTSLNAFPFSSGNGGQNAAVKR